MGTGNWRLANPTSTSMLTFDARIGRLVSTTLVALGALFLLMAMTYASFAMLKSWLMDQDRYLMANDIGPFPVPIMTWTASPTPTPIPTLTPTPLPTDTPTLVPTPLRGIISSNTTLANTKPTIALSPTDTSTPTITPTATQSPSPTPTPTSKPASAPAKIRIPVLRVNRSVIELSRTRDRRTGAWTWNTKRLFRSGRKDLVGHSEGSAYPGQEGNMILVGHNYGYGYNGVFVRLGKLKPGHKVYVTDRAGRSFTFQVTEVKKVKWRRKTLGELTQHLNFLATGGPERLTLVSCSGANVEPFPERVYVVAEPVR